MGLYEKEKKRGFYNKKLRFFVWNTSKQVSIKRYLYIIGLLLDFIEVIRACFYPIGVMKMRNEKEIVSGVAAKHLYKFIDKLELSNKEIQDLSKVIPYFRQYFLEVDNTATERVKIQKTIQSINVKKGYIMDKFHLTEKEELVLTYLLEGFSPAIIAEKLFLSVATIKTHINKNYSKKHVHNMQELIVGEYKKKFNSTDKPNSILEPCKEKRQVNIENLLDEIF